MNKINFFCLFALALILTCSGCSGGKSKVTGTVKFEDGSPLTMGTVIMEKDNFAGNGPINPDGTFSMGLLKANEGLPPGTYNVAIQGAEPEQGQYLIDQKLANTRTSEITYEVKSGEKNHFEITVFPPK